MDRDEVIRVLRQFQTAGLEYVLIGAAAMGFHGLVRATEDVDLDAAGLARAIQLERGELICQCRNSARLKK